jgi:hypothetical protein
MDAIEKALSALTAKDILKASTLITKSSQQTVKSALALILILSKVDKSI